MCLVRTVIYRAELRNSEDEKPGGYTIKTGRHWHLKFLEEALTDIFEAENMARIGPRHLTIFISLEERLLYMP